MPTDPACANCRFGVYIEDRKRGSFVVCRRYPPHPVAVLGENFSPGDTLQGYWPRTGPEDECGEHQFYPDEQPIADGEHVK